jgi:hypothetical protein
MRRRKAERTPFCSTKVQGPKLPMSLARGVVRLLAGQEADLPFSVCRVVKELSSAS